MSIAIILRYYSELDGGVARFCNEKATDGHMRPKLGPWTRSDRDDVKTGRNPLNRPAIELAPQQPVSGKKESRCWWRAVAVSVFPMILVRPTHCK